jgi:16S rRNA (cytidine1402-2'-O)-methyltransferase
MERAKVFLIPCPLYDGVNETLPAYLVDTIKKCTVFFVENERTTRRFFKSVWKEMVIDDYKWHTIHKAEMEVMRQFEAAIKANKTIGILSEVGCPSIADPGQLLIKRAQEMDAVIKPLVGPSSILLSLMASGLNGQQFKFNGYLPIDAALRKKAIQRLEQEAISEGTTQLFIETPFRNDALLKDILTTCRPSTNVCIAVDITSPEEWIVTKKVQKWKQSIPALHKKPVIFLLGV